MSFYFRDRPKFGDRLRGKSGDEILQEIKQQFDEDSKSFFEPTNRATRDPFERHSAFSRAFPFDDDGFGRRSDIRAHLDDLAARHPEFADHLLGPPWGDIPFHGSFRNRNRDSGGGSRNSSFQQGYPDEDARSQASGSSATSRTSAGSSHSEADQNQNHQDKPNYYKRSQIPQYGLRNTVDIGQHHHNMENPDRGNRSQRSMSAPPENRQSNQQQPQQEQHSQQQPQQGQRYVSRIDITPQHNQPPQSQQQQKPQQQPQQQFQQQPQQQQQQKPQQQGNVRHIPIFVEGRDEPVLPRSFDEAPHFKREPSPTQFHTPPHFQRSSPFGQHFGGRQWPSHFQDTFYNQPGGFEQPSRRQQQSHTYQQPRQPQYTERQPQQQHYEQPKQQRSQPQPQHQQQQPQPQPQQQQQQQQQQELPKPKPTLPKDPLERVALVQKEVDSLAEQVKQYTGNSRTDKEYIYLDEMLTRELIKLDDIETEGRDNVRQARKNAIKSIQETISLLESKAPLPSQAVSQEEHEQQENQAMSNAEEAGQTEKMDVDQKEEERPPNKEAIPLPPGPSSPTKKSEETNQASVEKVENPSNDQTVNQQQPEVNQAPPEPMDTTPAGKVEATPMEVQQSPEQTNVPEEKKAENASEEKKQENSAEEKKTDAPLEKKEENAASEENKSETTAEEKKVENVSEEKKAENQEHKKDSASEDKKKNEKEKKSEKADSNQSEQEKQQKTGEKMEVESEVKKSPKTQKKGKKTKKQSAPVSDKPIPLPAPENAEANAK